ncbi:hypothetical protein GCM10027589_14730 [Actinocorallia lasiicapitis]
MKKVAIFAPLAAFALALAAAPAYAEPAPTVTVAKAQGGRVAPGQYIVTLKDGASLDAVLAHGGVKETLHRYENALNGFAARLTPANIKKLSSDARVISIEEDRISFQSGVQTNPPSWGLDRIDQAQQAPNQTYQYNSTGAGVHAYILDSGIYAAHPDFGGRASVAYDATGGDGSDCSGHGTHIAGTIGGTTYGVAKEVSLHAVKWYNTCDGGNASDLIEGVDWVIANAQRPAVASFSNNYYWAHPSADSVKQAFNRLSNAGIFVAVSAGNNGGNACSYPPANAAGATTVAAIDSDGLALNVDFPDGSTAQSNIGGCVDIWAPGGHIISAGLDGGSKMMSGTSMAAPHVAGVAALYKATYGDASAATIRSWLTSHATPNVVTNYTKAMEWLWGVTPNLLLNTSGL